MTAATRLATHVPLVSYSGLWDKFGAPNSLGAIRRAYLRNVACVVRATEALETIDDICAIAEDPAINRQGHALLLADDRRGGARILPLYLRRDGGWIPCGIYVPVRTAHLVTAADLCGPVPCEAPLILVESSNVLEALEEPLVMNGRTDDDVLAQVQALLPDGAQLARVSDYVELDFLERQQEAV